jgi:hypothetical protein
MKPGATLLNVSRGGLIDSGGPPALPLPSPPRPRKGAARALAAPRKQPTAHCNASAAPIPTPDALIDALRSGHLGGVGLDVFEGEGEEASLRCDPASPLPAACSGRSFPWPCRLRRRRRESARRAPRWAPRAQARCSSRTGRRSSRWTASSSGTAASRS